MRPFERSSCPWLTLAIRRCRSAPMNITKWTVRPVYKTYPIYAPGKEPADYLEWLKQQEPEIVFDAAKLKTEATGSARENSSSMHRDSSRPWQAQMCAIQSATKRPAFYWLRMARCRSAAM